MSLAMVGVDCNTAGMETRETFALPPESLPEALARIRGSDGVDGCALISTCNRTELYISCDDGFTPDAAELLCAALGLDPMRERRRLVVRHEGQAIEHLLQVAAGLRSGVLGDCQIITQVRAAIEAARRCGASDSILETLFRCAVTAGKRVKTSVRFVRAGNSVAGEAVRAIADAFGGLAGKRALVIGNGATGRQAAENLLARGAEVMVTLRNSRRPPHGCEGVPFDDRYARMDGCDLAISATTSPSFTVELSELRRLKNIPRIFADLAVPRDVDPAVGNLDGVTLWNVDDFFRPGGGDENAASLGLALDIVGEEARRFELWRRSRLRRTRSTDGVPDFPAFINLHGATALMVGAGRVAARRAGVLLGFGATVRVVAPELGAEMEKLAGRAGLIWIRRGYAADDLDGATLAVAATDDREVNRRVGQDARERGILVSVADRRAECTFYFPAVVKSENFTAGIVSSHSDHSLVKKAAAAIRRELENFDENHSCGQQGQCVGGGAIAPGHGGGEAATS